MAQMTKEFSILPFLWSNGNLELCHLSSYFYLLISTWHTLLRKGGMGIRVGTFSIRHGRDPQDLDAEQEFRLLLRDGHLRARTSTRYSHLPYRVCAEPIPQYAQDK